MTSILVWVLLTWSAGRAQFPVQLGPYADLQSCEAVRKALGNYPGPTCIQVRVPVAAVKEIR
jgi:hypothetical protein